MNFSLQQRLWKTFNFYWSEKTNNNLFSPPKVKRTYA